MPWKVSHASSKTEKILLIESQTNYLAKIARGVFLLRRCRPFEFPVHPRS